MDKFEISRRVRKGNYRAESRERKRRLFRRRLHLRGLLSMILRCYKHGSFMKTRCFYILFFREEYRKSLARRLSAGNKHQHGATHSRLVTPTAHTRTPKCFFLPKRWQCIISKHHPQPAEHNESLNCFATVKEVDRLFSFNYRQQSNRRAGESRACFQSKQPELPTISPRLIVTLLSPGPEPNNSREDAGPGRWRDNNRRGTDRATGTMLGYGEIARDLECQLPELTSKSF